MIRKFTLVLLLAAASCSQKARTEASGDKTSKDVPHGIGPSQEPYSEAKFLGEVLRDLLVKKQYPTYRDSSGSPASKSLTIYVVIEGFDAMISVKDFPKEAGPVKYVYVTQGEFESLARSRLNEDTGPKRFLIKRAEPTIEGWPVFSVSGYAWMMQGGVFKPISSGWHGSYAYVRVDGRFHPVFFKYGITD